MKHLLPKTNYYKANLHTHSTISDGKLSPKEVKEAYKKLGYQILALTDHNIIVDHSDMTEEDFLMLTAVEININHENYRARFFGKTYHFNLISKTPKNLWIPTKAPHKYPGGLAYEDKMQCEEMPLTFDVESANQMIAKANEMGFLVIFNHPTWSCLNYHDYAGLKGYWGMELRNSECCLLGNNENNAGIWKELSNLGNKIFPIGADDMHFPRAVGLSWIMVGSDKLKYESVIEALEKGDFYMSCGPEIHNLTLENNVLKISCSDARFITLECQERFARRCNAESENWLHEAEFDITKFIERSHGDESMYLHLTVTAPDGSYAATRAYYLNELISR
ncbi:MAG: hypothetical protein IKT50_01360 [Clostridia bacterium]|nr:hypothetical protein [Clostridia bacterium]